MKVIIAGSRDITDREELNDAVRLFEDKYGKITQVIEGGAPGVDRMGRKFAQANKIPYRTIDADWKKFGKSAGPRRNTEMAEAAEGLVALWDGKSTGTKDMIFKANQRNLKVYVHHYAKASLR